MRELPPLPEYGHAFSPRWPGDPGGFTVQQMHAHAAAARLAALEEAAKACESIASDIYGMTNPREFGECAAAIRALAIHVPPTCIDSCEK